MSFAQRIAMIRKEMHLSQDKFGELVNVSQRTVAFWESGQRMPSHAVLALISEKTNCSTDYLLGLSDIRNNSKKPATDGDGLREYTIDRINALPKSELRRLLDLMDAAPNNPISDSASAAAPQSSDQSDPE